MLLRPSLVAGIRNIIPGAAISHAMTDALDVTVPSDVAWVALNLTVAMTVRVGAGDEAAEKEEEG